MAQWNCASGSGDSLVVLYIACFLFAITKLVPFVRPLSRAASLQGEPVCGLAEEGQGGNAPNRRPLGGALAACRLGIGTDVVQAQIFLNETLARGARGRQEGGGSQRQGRQALEGRSERDARPLAPPARRASPLPPGRPFPPCRVRPTGPITRFEHIGATGVSTSSRGSICLGGEERSVDRRSYTFVPRDGSDTGMPRTLWHHLRADQLRYRLAECCLV